MKIGKDENNALEQEEDDGVFYFESDHLALRGNADYSEVLKTMFILEAQRSRALQDFHKVIELKQMYLNDPLLYIEKSQSGTLDIPPLHHIAEIPKINWSQYPVNVPKQFMRQINSTRMQTKPKEEATERNYKAWTLEEQRKLEELLVKYPPEEVDRKRVVKIANELGTRTRAQVASRLQKYYQKLMQAGLPVPGPLPKAARKYCERKAPYKQQRNYHRQSLKPSTFFPDTIVPVVMDEHHAPGPSTSSAPSNGSGSRDDAAQSNYLLSNDYHVDRKSLIHADNVDIEVELLKWVKTEKIIESQGTLHQHYGYKCDYCAEDPIQGSRWHCTTCVHDSIDFCTDCILSQFYSETAHDIHHKFLVIRNEKEVTSGFWSDSDSENDIKSNDDDSDSEDSCMSLAAESAHENHNVSKMNKCPSEVFDSNHRNGDDYV